MPTKAIGAAPRVFLRAGLGRHALLDLVKAIIRVKAHMRNGRMVEAHDRDIQSKAERKELVHALALKLAGGDHTKHHSLASALGAARHASRVNGKAAHVYQDPNGHWRATHDALHTKDHAERIVVTKGRAVLHAPGEKPRGLGHIRGRVDDAHDNPVKRERKKKPSRAKPKPPAEAAHITRLLATADVDPQTAMIQFYGELDNRKAEGTHPTGAFNNLYNADTKQFLLVADSDYELDDVLRQTLTTAGFKEVTNLDMQELKRVLREAKRLATYHGAMETFDYDQARRDYLASASEDPKIAAENGNLYMTRRRADGTHHGYENNISFYRESDHTFLDVLDTDFNAHPDLLDGTGYQHIDWSTYHARKSDFKKKREDGWVATPASQILASQPGIYHLYRGAGHGDNKKLESTASLHKLNAGDHNMAYALVGDTEAHTKKHRDKQHGYSMAVAQGVTVTLAKPLDMTTEAKIQEVANQLGLSDRETAPMFTGGPEKMPEWALNHLRRLGYDAVIGRTKGGKGDPAIALLDADSHGEIITEFHAREDALIQLANGHPDAKDNRHHNLTSPLQSTGQQWLKQAGIKSGGVAWGTALARHRAQIIKAVAAGDPVPAHVRESVYQLGPKTKPKGAPAHEVRAKLIALVDEAKAEIDRLHDIGTDLTYKMMTFGDGRMYLGTTPWSPEYHALDKANQNQSILPTQAIEAKRDAAIKKLLHAPKPMKMTLSIESQGAHSDLPAGWREGVNDFCALVGERSGEWGVHVRLNGKNEEARAHYSQATTTVMMSDTCKRTMVHELGHMLEYSDPETIKASAAFVERRTKGDPWVRLKDLYPTSNYGDDEWCRPDKFIHPYIGKTYGPTKCHLKPAEHEVVATEVISMGLDTMHADPYALATKDHELFDLVWNTIRNTK
jgi:hypothetical protein